MSTPRTDDRVPPPRTGLRRWRRPLMVAGPLVILAVVGVLMLTSGRYETTDNAYVQVAKSPVAPSIAGRVVEVYVHENEAVKRGQVLFKLDARDLGANLAAARAELAQAELQVRAQRAAYQQQQVAVKAAQEQVDYTAREAARQRKLAEAGVIAQQDVDKAENAARQARHDLAEAREAAAQALAVLGGSAGGSVGAHPTVLQARARLERARLNVDYATVVAPADGVVARVDQIQPGTYLNASETAFWLLSGRPWIEANFKEDQIGRMRIGQPAEIDIDAYPDGALHGHVASFSPGTGAAFSALPAQNATGNWVKVTQRLPVRIAFDNPPPGMAARAGLSAKVKVDVRAPADER